MTGSKLQLNSPHKGGELYSTLPPSQRVQCSSQEYSLLIRNWKREVGEILCMGGMRTGKRSSRKAEGGSRREVQNALSVDWTCEPGTGGRKAEYGE